MQSEMPGYLSTVRRASRAEITQLTVGTSPSTTRPDGGPAGGLDFVAHLVDLPDDARGARQQQAAGIGQHHAAAVPGEQVGAQFMLEQLDLAAQRRLRHPQRVGGLAEAAEFRHATEGPELPDIHACQSSKAGSYAITIQHRETGAGFTTARDPAIDIPHRSITRKSNDRTRTTRRNSDIRDAVAKLCAQFPGEYWRKLDREMAYPKEFVDALTEAGYLSALIPEEYGGAGLTLSAAAAILEEIQRAGCNGGGCHAQMYTMGTLLRHGSDEQKAKYLPKIASGELRLQAFGVTEPTSGTDTSSLKTVAKRDGNDGYVVNGQKIWTSRAEHSDLMLLLARTTPKEQAKKRTDGLSVFIVDMREAKGKGLTIRPIRTMMNHATTEVFFTDMRVPAENLIGEEGKGFRYILSGMNAERILIAAECIGDAKWFIDKATAYAKERAVFGRPIGQNQGIQFPIAKAYAAMRAAELMVQEATRKYEAGLDCGAEANMAKMLAADASWEAANACVQTHGGFGFAEEYDVERKFRETRLYQVAPISTNLILSYVAEHVLGLPRSY